MQKNILISGGAGFIGSNLLRHLLQKYPSYNIICIDKLTYAGNTANLEDLFSYANFHFLQADICDFEKICSIFELYKIDSVIHLAAESHVDRSIEDPFIFARTNVLGTLACCKPACRLGRLKASKARFSIISLLTRSMGPCLWMPPRRSSGRATSMTRAVPTALPKPVRIIL